MAATPEWTTALPDWERRIVAGEPLLPCGPLFPDEAAASMAVFRALRIVDAAGSPTFGGTMLPWAIDFAEVIFGAYDQESGRRLINDFFLLISKKNGKSTFAAGVMLTALVRCWRKSAEFIILAPTLEIANNSWQPTLDAVNADPELRKILRPIPHVRTILHMVTGATLKVIAAEQSNVGGKKTVGLLIDELHLFGKKAKAREMLREAEGGLAARPEGFTIALTTQSDEPPAGVFKDRLDRFRAIRDGRTVAPHALGVLYEFPEAMREAKAYEDSANFYITNPNLGVSVDEQFLINEHEKAKGEGLASVAGFYAKHINVEIGLALRSDRWTGADFWEAAGDRSVTLEHLLDSCDVVCAGVDGGGLDDLLGFALIGRHRETRDWLHWGHAWASQIVLERRKSEATKLQGFVKDGDLTLVEDMQDAFRDLAARVVEVHERGVLAGLGIDPSGVGLILDAIAEAFDAAGIEVDLEKLVKGVFQDRPLQGAIKTVEVKLAGGTFRHGAQPIVAWAVGNAKLERKTNYFMITKAVSGVAKIDPLMALFDAAQLMTKNPEPPRAGSYTDHEDVIVL